jgi:hypothetical protein
LIEANGLPLAIHLTSGQPVDILAATDKLGGRRRLMRRFLPAWRMSHHAMKVEPQ